MLLNDCCLCKSAIVVILNSKVIACSMVASICTRVNKVGSLADERKKDTVGSLWVIDWY